MQQKHMPVSCYCGNRAYYPILLAGLMIVSLAGAMNCSKSPDNKLVLLPAALVGLQNSTGAGSPHYKVFVTAGIHAPSMGGIAGADSLCASAANRPSDGNTYRALLVDGTNRVACTTSNCAGGVAEHSDWILAPTTTYVRSDGTTELFTTNADGIFAYGTATNSWDGTLTEVWTGFSSADWIAGDDCTDWSGPAGGGRVGSLSQTDGTMISLNLFSCSIAQRALLCVQQ